MFTMTVEEAMNVDNFGVVSGKCNDSLEFTNNLIDENGNIYVAEMPLSVTSINDRTRIAIGLKGVSNAKKLIGKTLTGVA